VTFFSERAILTLVSSAVRNDLDVGAYVKDGLAKLLAEHKPNTPSCGGKHIGE